MANRYVYVVQFGACWRYTQADWKAFVAERLVDGPGYVLPDERRLARLPAIIHRSRDTSYERYWIDTKRHDLREPLDWDENDWRYEAEDLGLIEPQGATA